MSQATNSSSNSDIVFLINCASGTNSGKSLIRRLQQLRGQMSVEVVSICWPEINAQVKQASHAKLVVIAGGDGTLSSLIPMFINLDTEIAILPIGTGNDLARELKRPADPSLSSLISQGVAALKNDPICLDIWQIVDTNTKEKLASFVNYFSIGFSAEVISKFSRERNKNAPKFKLFQRIKYCFMGMKSLRARVPSRISIKTKDTSLPLAQDNKNLCLIFSNISSWMGCAKVQDSNPSDGLLEATVATSLLSYAKMLLATFLPSLTLSAIGRSDTWYLDRLDTPLITNRDGEEFLINTSAVSIEVFGKISIRGVITA